MNYILSKLGEVDQRVTTLEQGGTSVGQVTVTNFVPPNQIAAGQELVVLGTNFDFPATNNTVTIDGTPITTFRPGSTSTSLRFIVPTTLTIPPGGKNVVVRVANTTGEYSSLYRVLEAVTAPGNPPVISDVQPVVGPLIMVNTAILISGQNFALTPADNVITFRLTLSAGLDVVYPLPGQSIQINAANSNDTQIEVTVPDITEIPAGQSRNVIVSVGVGAHVPAVRSVTIRR
jgi:hypothetical protein